MILSKRNIQAHLPARFEPTPQALAIAKQAIEHLWNERRAERGLTASDDRSGSCKFAALLARDLFGGRLAGNLEHVFTLQKDGRRIDLNDDQADVLELGDKAHRLDCWVLAYAEYRASLSSCRPRAERWSAWAAERITSHTLDPTLHPAEGPPDPRT